MVKAITEINGHIVSSLAPQACAACRKQKRKCDKQMPTCSLCTKIGRHCDYADDVLKAPNYEDFHALRDEVAALKSMLQQGLKNNNHGCVDDTNQTQSPGNSTCVSAHGSTDGAGTNILTPMSSLNEVTPPPTNKSSVPSILFLDSKVFTYSHSTIQPIHLQVPPGALSSLGDSAEFRLMIEEYFDSVHIYFPIISKIRLYQHLANPFHDPGADVALLFMAMKLASTGVPHGEVAESQLYQSVKSLFTYVEARNAFSIQLIQALLLIALYEIGQGIHPASYLTTGHAARLGHAMGLHEWGAPQMLPNATSWTEQEERRRVWWAVIILDRFVNLSVQAKPFASADPSPESHLPTEDEPWDRGQMIIAAPLILGASPTVQAAPFARICQAAYLLGKVVRHLNDKSIPVDYRFDEALQLHRTVRALVSLMTEEVAEIRLSPPRAVCTSIAICFSTLFDLYDGYSCTELTVPDAPETQLVMQKESIEGTRVMNDAVMVFSQRVKILMERDGLNHVSPLIISALYCAAANFACDFNECSNTRSAQCYQELVEMLQVLNERWRVAGAYVTILETFWKPKHFGDNAGMRSDF